VERFGVTGVPDLRRKLARADAAVAAAAAGKDPGLAPASHAAISSHRQASLGPRALFRQSPDASLEAAARLSRALSHAQRVSAGHLRTRLCLL
jgi:hypothetical protein